MFLTKEQIKRLTGCTYKRLQIGALRKMGIPYFVNAVGEPIVVSAVLEGRKEAVNDEWQPNVLRKA